MMTFKYILNNLIPNSISTVRVYARVYKSAILLALSCAFAPTSHASDDFLDGIAAIVNSDVIMVSEVKGAAQQLKSEQISGMSSKQVFKEVLEKLIIDKIQVQKSKSVGIKIDDAAVDSAMQRIAEQNKLNLQQLRKALIKQGKDYKEFRENIRDRLYKDTLLLRQQSRSNDISENEIDELIQTQSFKLNQGVQYHIIDIHLPNNVSSVQSFNSNLVRAQHLRNKLLLNKTLSSPEITKLGGTRKDLGWKNAETLSPIYSRTLSLLSEGEISDVIRDSNGLHILKLVKQRGGERQKITEARVRHILINAKEPQAKLKATQLRNKILAGANFSQLATKYSADKGSAVKGGELPMANTEKYVAPFATAANTLPLNTLSQPIQTTFGFHILEVLERRKSDKTRETLKIKAKEVVGKNKRSEELNTWLKTLREEAYVEYRVSL